MTRMPKVKKSTRKPTLIALSFYLKNVSVGRSQNKEDGTTSEHVQMKLISITGVYK